VLFLSPEDARDLLSLAVAAAVLVSLFYLAA
jgi:hypothetical protein